MTGTTEIFGGDLAILNVGKGDTKLSFDPNNPQDCIRAARIVKDMLRRGYALLVEVEIDGKKIFKRATDFIEGTFEYVIADLDPIEAQRVDQQDRATPALRVELATPAGIEHAENESSAAAELGATDAPRAPKNGRRGRRVPATSARAVGVAHTAGG